MQGQSHREQKDRLQPTASPRGTTALTLENKPKPIDGLGCMPFLPFPTPSTPTNGAERGCELRIDNTCYRSQESCRSKMRPPGTPLLGTTFHCRHRESWTRILSLAAEWMQLPAKVLTNIRRCRRHCTQVGGIFLRQFILSHPAHPLAGSALVVVHFFKCSRLWEVPFYSMNIACQGTFSSHSCFCRAGPRSSYAPPIRPQGCCKTIKTLIASHKFAPKVQFKRLFC